MIVRGTNNGEIEAAAAATGVELRNVRREGRGVAFVIRPLSEKYKRRSHTGRRVHAVCWHGHRDFYRAIFEAAPDAVIITARARYNGADHFEQTYEQTDGNIGSQAQPMYYSDACDCT